MNGDMLISDPPSLKLRRGRLVISGRHKRRGQQSDIRHQTSEVTGPTPAKATPKAFTAGGVASRRQTSDVSGQPAENRNFQCSTSNAQRKSQQDTSVARGYQLKTYLSRRSRSRGGTLKNL